MSTCVFPDVLECKRTDRAVRITLPRRRGKRVCPAKKLTISAAARKVRPTRPGARILRLARRKSPSPAAGRVSANGRRDETAGRGADHPKSGPGDLEPKVRVIDNCILPPSPTYMPARYPLLVHPRARAKRPTFDQERFAFLLEQIERARAAQAGRESLYAGFRRDHAAILSPLRQRLRATCRDTVFALDRLLDQRGWSRAEQSILVDMLRATTTALLETGTHDEEVKHIY